MNYTFKNSMKILAAAMITSSLLLTGCGGYKTLSQQNDEVAYLKFSAPMDKNFTVMVNDTKKFTVEACTNKGDVDSNTACTDKVYEVNAGNVSLKVYDRSGNLFMEQNVFIGSGNTKEVLIQ